MNYEELLHCARAVAELTGENELYLFGSQSPLMHYQVLPGYASLSREADIMTAYNSEENSYLIDGNFMAGTQFAETFGLEIDGVLEEELSLSPTWKDRAIDYEYQIEDNKTLIITVPDTNDIALAKLCAGREKDRKWLEALYNEELLDTQLIYQLIWTLNTSFDNAQYIANLLQRIIDGNNSSWE